MSELYAPCANCGTMAPTRAMLRDRQDGSLHCLACPGEDWLRRVYGDAAAAELVALREGRPGAPTLAEIAATYPERRGAPRPDTCPQGHPFTEENTYRRPDGRRACRACIAAYRHGRKAVAA